MPTFGLAIKNFVGPAETPDIDALYAYAQRAEALGFESLWAWDHVILGVEPSFPILDAVGTLTALAARTSRTWRAASTTLGGAGSRRRPTRPPRPPTLTGGYVAAGLKRWPTGVDGWLTYSNPPKGYGGRGGKSAGFAARPGETRRRSAAPI